ncbi:MAG: SCP2 sterol-binding domain-containing protein [Acidobacteria bacterium]|nr:SCP2 sterol-binding domain-containing protein [Acidobacteriota bacterium]MBI3657082.1 SCP2 sterol-binding domain-containing protein [Acidobacteriota bacterium]
MSDVLTSDQVMKDLSARFQVAAAKGLQVVYQFDIVGDGGGQWYAEINDGTCKVEAGVHPTPKVTFTLNSKDHVDMFTGKLNHQMAFMTGRLKLKGDMGMALKFAQLFK